MALLSLLRGIWLLRRPAVVRLLGDLTTQATQLEALRGAYPGAYLHADASLFGWRPERLKIAEGVRIEKGTLLTFGDDLNGFGEIVIGPRTWVGPYNNIRSGSGSKVEIGADCLISQFVSLVATNHDIGRDGPMIAKPCGRRKLGVTLGSDVWIGAGAAVLPGVRVGDGAVIGANSVVTHEVPPYEIWGGVPARKIGERK